MSAPRTAHPGLRNELWQANPRCTYCNRPLVRRREGCLDHCVPLSRGGRDDETNIVLSCIRCDRRKDNRTPRELLQWARRVVEVSERVK